MPLGRHLTDFFHLNRGERSGLIVLCTVLAGLLVWHTVLPKLASPDPPDMSTYEILIREFEIRQSALMDSLQRHNQPKRQKSTKPTLNPFPFDPNDLPVDQWMAMGLSEKQVRVIKNYERKGGKFYTPEDLSKMYSLSDAEYQILRPYIRIKKHNSYEKETATLPKPHQSKSDSPTISVNITELNNAGQILNDHNQPPPLTISINEADTLDLQLLPGIGPVFSKRIFGYRELLGGFYNAGQLREVYGMDSLRFAGIQQFIHIDTTILEKINLNKTVLKRFIRHPYIDFALAKMIVSDRGQHGDYRSLPDLRERLHLPEEVYLKIRPYLEINPVIQSEIIEEQD